MPNAFFFSNKGNCSGGMGRSLRRIQIKAGGNLSRVTATNGSELIGNFQRTKFGHDNFMGVFTKDENYK